MTIDEFVRNFKIKIDQLYVKDADGNYITAPGNTKFTNVSVSYFQDGKLADLEFTV